jgi:quercetin dioxygenase-like cupin family protein
MKNQILLSVLITINVFGISAQKTLNSSVYDWEKLILKKTSSGEAGNFIKSPTRSLDMFEIEAVFISDSKKKWISMVESGSDELIIIKEGVVEIHVNSERKILGEGSVIVAGSNDKVTISKNTNVNAVLYLIKFKPPQTITQKIVYPLLFDWNKIEFKTTEKGGSRSIIRQQTSVLKELEIHVTTLNEGMTSHSAHSHPDEEIILVRKGFVEETIKGVPYRLGPGSIIFLSNDDPHNIRNAGEGQCEYYAIRWLTELPKLK